MLSNLTGGSKHAACFVSSCVVAHILQGFQGAFIATGRDNRPSGTGFVVFDSEGAQAAAYKVSVAQHGLGWHCCIRHGPKVSRVVQPTVLRDQIPPISQRRARKPGILARRGLVHQQQL